MHDLVFSLGRPSNAFKQLWVKSDQSGINLHFRRPTLPSLGMVTAMLSQDTALDYAFQTQHWGSAIHCLSGNRSLDGVRRQKQSATTPDSQSGRINRCHIISLLSIRYQIQLNIIYRWVFAVSTYRNRPPPPHLPPIHTSP